MHPSQRPNVGKGRSPAPADRPWPLTPAVGPLDPSRTSRRAPEEPRSKDGHIPVLDGVRGLAIVLVIAHHGIQAWGPMVSPLEKVWGLFSGRAWVGVDLFFVLSGFLITGILLDTKGKDRYFSSFYPRRMLRTFPLYYATILVCFVLLPNLPIAGIEGLRELSTRQGWFWLHASNFYNLAHNITTMDGPDIGWMATFWSLAVEEHFYLVWPLVVFFCSPKGVLRACVGVLAAGLLLRVVFAAQGRDFQYIYNNTFTRLDGPILGSLVAVLSRREAGLSGLVGPARRVLLAAAGLIGALLLVQGIAKQTYAFCASTIVFSAIAVAFGCLLVLVLESPERSVLKRLFSLRFLQVCGKYSFAMYILNVPLFMFLNLYCPPESRLLGSRVPVMVAYTVTGVLLSLAGAQVTWHLLEKHCLKLKKFFTASRPTVVLPVPVPRPGLRRAPDRRRSPSSVARVSPVGERRRDFRRGQGGTRGVAGPAPVGTPPQG